MEQSMEKVKKINAVVSKKIFGKQRSSSGKKVKDDIVPSQIEVYLSCTSKILLIAPALFIGFIAGILAFFQTMLKTALDTFNGRLKG